MTTKNIVFFSVTAIIFVSVFMFGPLFAFQQALQTARHDKNHDF